MPPATEAIDMRRHIGLVSVLLLGCQEPVTALDAAMDDAGPAPLDASSRCGNASVDPGEACDDGNTIAFDGCESDCARTCDDDAECVDDSECNGVEECAPCEDAACATGRACRAGTTLDDGTECALEAATGVCHSGDCVMMGCGNAVVEDGEHCDDGNTTTRDGCESDCRFSCELDASLTNRWYLDCDGDSFATTGVDPVEVCLEPAPDACGGGWTLRVPGTGAADCDDTASDVRPGAAEVCDGEDTDCDGEIDDGVTSTFYLDSDGDDHGNPASAMVACSLPAGHAVLGDDCNDACAACYPGATEICDDADNDCDTSIDDGVTTTFYRDGDGDGRGAGAGIQACSAPANHVTNADDCNDGNSGIYLGAPEVCDGADNNCDGATDEGVRQNLYRDADGDGFGAGAATVMCPTPGWVTNDDDCHDDIPYAFPGQTEYVAIPIDSEPPATDYDYNCDGVETPRYTLRGVGPSEPCSAGTSQPCNGRDGWSSSTEPVPQCGTYAFFSACDLFGGTTCRRMVYMQDQGCR
jgi:cysteine-rich repeat protein